jgi:thymidylate kinase
MSEITNKNYSKRWNSLSAKIFSDLVEEFEHKNIRYFILRNYEGLPEVNNSKDIDIIIEPRAYKKASTILFSIFKQYNISHCHIVKYERVRCWFGIYFEQQFSIHIDLIEGYLNKGFEVFPFELLYKNTEKYNGFNVLNKPFDAIVLLYYKVIGTKELKDKYREKISSIYLVEKGNIGKILQETLTEKCSNTVLKALETNNYADIIANAKLMSKTSKRKAFLRRPVYTFGNILNFWTEKFHRIIICPRRFQNFIAVEGADGTGKSTFIEGLQNAIIYYYVSDETKCHVYHHRPTILPNLGALGEKAGVKEQDTDFTNPHRGKPKGFISSLVRMTYYWLDYVIGVPLLMRKDVQFDKFTIYDRYIYDFLIDPYRASIQLPHWLRKTFTKLVIQPRIVFVLLTDAKTIYNRKQELTVEEINRQLGEFEKLAKTNKRFVVIDASKSPQEMVDEAMTVIIERFTRRIKE